jgi:deazaflavin-dependent oxidoreductase (nitroreductase family)
VSESYLTPNLFVQRIANPLAMRLGLATTLQIRRRVSGATQALPVNVLELDGEEYLVSVRGHSQWVRNLRASGRCELRRRGRLRSYTAEELPVDRRTPLIEAYRKRWGYQVGAFFKQLPDPADHPVFVLRRP